MYIYKFNDILITLYGMYVYSHLKEKILFLSDNFEGVIFHLWNYFKR